MTKQVHNMEALVHLNVLVDSRDGDLNKEHFDQHLRGR